MRWLFYLYVFHLAVKDFLMSCKYLSAVRVKLQEYK